MILKLRSASHRDNSTPPIIAATISPARSVRVANSSSDKGTGPVRRTVTPCSGVRPSALAWARILPLASCPGSRALKSSRGLTSMKRRISSGLGAAPGDQRTPGQIFGLAMGGGAEHIGEARHRAVNVCKLGLAGTDTQQHGGQVGHDPAQAGVRRQPAQKGLGLDQLLGGVLHLFQGQEQQTVLAEKRPAVGTADMGEQVRIGGEFFGQPRGGGFCQLGRLAVDHHQGQVGLLRKGGVELRLAHAPAHLGVDQLFAVGVDGEILLGIPAGGHRQQQADQDHSPGPAAAKTDNTLHDRHKPVRAFSAPVKSAPSGGLGPPRGMA